MELSKRNRIVSLLYVVPALALMLGLIGYPILFNIKISFQDFTLTTLSSGNTPFIGFDNYINIMDKDTFWKALRNTLYFTMWCIVLQFIVGFALALFFNLKFKLAGVLRGMTLVAWLVPTVVTSLLFKFMLNQNGIINYFLSRFGIVDAPVAWLTDPTLAMWSLIIANVWVGAPFNMMLLSTGLSSLPTNIYEAASIDGAGKFKKFLFMTLPMMKPVILVVVMMGFIYTLKVFDLIFVMTGGGPVDATEALSTLSYRLSFSQFDFGSGAAVANVLFVILLVISLVYLRLVRDDEVM